MNALRNLLDSRLHRLRASLLPRLHSSSSLARLLRRLSSLLPLLLRLFGSSLGGLFLLRFTRLRAAELLAPLLLLLRLDLREEVGGFADGVADGDGAGLPVVGDGEEGGVQLGEDRVGCYGPGLLGLCSVWGVDLLIEWQWQWRGGQRDTRGMGKDLHIWLNQRS